MSSPIRECLACEKHFSLSDEGALTVNPLFKDQYCSKRCEDEFEAALALGVAEAESRGLITPEQPKPTAAEKDPSQLAKDLIAGWNLKHPNTKE